MPEQRDRVPLTVPELQLVFDGLELVVGESDDPVRTRDAVELAGRVRAALDRAKRRQAAPS